MSAALRMVTLAEVMDLGSEVMDFAAVSETLIELRYDGARAGLIGFIPQGTEAYLWMHKTPVALAHRISFARYAKKIIRCYLTKYTAIRGHSNPASARWLKFLGATITTKTPALVEFTIHG